MARPDPDCETRVVYVHIINTCVCVAEHPDHNGDRKATLDNNGCFMSWIVLVYYTRYGLRASECPVFPDQKHQSTNSIGNGPQNGCITKFCNGKLV